MSKRVYLTSDNWPHGLIVLGDLSTVRSAKRKHWMIGVGCGFCGAIYLGCFMESARRNHCCDFLNRLGNVTSWVDLTPRTLFLLIPSSRYQSSEWHSRSVREWCNEGCKKTEHTSSHNYSHGKMIEFDFWLFMTTLPFSLNPWHCQAYARCCSLGFIIGGYKGGAPPLICKQSLNFFK
jgi:hypothetical protein